MDCVANSYEYDGSHALGGKSAEDERNCQTHDQLSAATRNENTASKEELCLELASFTRQPGQLVTGRSSLGQVIDRQATGNSKWDRSVQTIIQVGNGERLKECHDVGNLIVLESDAGNVAFS